MLSESALQCPKACFLNVMAKCLTCDTPRPFRIDQSQQLMVRGIIDRHFKDPRAGLRSKAVQVLSQVAKTVNDGRLQSWLVRQCQKAVRDARPRVHEGWIQGWTVWRHLQSESLSLYLLCAPPLS